jgi:hypothetical protein
MAQADSVRSSSRQLITGESAKQSTKRRALSLPAVSIQPVDRHYFIGSSDARVITYTDEAPVLWLWRERRPELEDLPNCRWYADSTGQEHMGSNSGALSFETVVFVLRNILILLRFRSRNKHLRFSPFDNVSPNRLVPSKPQGRLR